MTENTTYPSRRFERSFIATLIEDVIAVDAHRRSDDNQPNRRSLIRTIFAAIEGSVWICREHVREAAKSLGEITPLIDMALRELTYTVSERGEVIEQVRYVTLPAMIRLTVRQAQRLAPGLRVEFGDAGWTNLRSAIVIRNRITHPKSIDDLLINDSNIATVRDALHWTLSVTERVAGASVAAQADHNSQTRELLDALIRDDPEALRAYREAEAETSDDD